jgi:hypothetical protein
MFAAGFGLDADRDDAEVLAAVGFDFDDRCAAAGFDFDDRCSAVGLVFDERCTASGRNSVLPANVSAWRPLSRATGFERDVADLDVVATRFAVVLRAGDFGCNDLAGVKVEPLRAELRAEAGAPERDRNSIFSLSSPRLL